MRPQDHRHAATDLDLDCKVLKNEANVAEIACDYRFSAMSGESKVAEALVTYFLVYELSGTEPAAEADLAEFAIANGTLHSWPFSGSSSTDSLREWDFHLIRCLSITLSQSQRERRRHRGRPQELKLANREGPIG